MILWILASVLYLAIAGLFFHVVTRMKKNISQRKFYVKHPDRFRAEFGSVTMDVICSLLWPFQIIGLLVYGMKG